MSDRLTREQLKEHLDRPTGIPHAANCKHPYEPCSCGTRNVWRRWLDDDGQLVEPQMRRGPDPVPAGTQRCGCEVCENGRKLGGR